jgi:MFS family permease
VVDAGASVSLWRSVHGLGDFWRLLQLRIASQFADGLFQAGLAGGLLFNPERAADPVAIAGAFAVLFLPYSVLGPFTGALLDRWDRRAVLVVANAARLVLVIGVAALLAAGAADLPVLCAALTVNGVGPKLALAVLSGGRVQDIQQAIRLGDFATLRRIKGVGEIGLVPTAGAVATAMHSLDGQWRNTLPMRRDKQEE